MVASGRHEISQSEACNGHFALNKVSSWPRKAQLPAPGSSPFGESHDQKEKTQGGELIATGKQTSLPHAYSAMDYYFDHLKKTVASAPSGGTEFGEKVKAYAEKNIAATQEFVRGAGAFTQKDILRYGFEFADGIHANAIGSLWRSRLLQQPRRGVLSKRHRVKRVKPFPVKVMHAPLLSTRPW